MAEWAWNEGTPYRNRPDWFTVTFPADALVFHPVRKTDDGYEVATDIICRGSIHLKSKQAVEDYLTNWRNNHMPVYNKLQVGDRVKYNQQWLYCWMGGWKWNISGAWDHMRPKEELRGELIEVVPQPDGKTLTIVRWDGIKEVEAKPGRPFIVELMPEDDPRTAFSRAAFEAHMRKCTTFGAHN